jgi:hypothetical protein
MSEQKSVCVGYTNALESFLKACRIPHETTPVGLTNKRIVFEANLAEFIQRYDEVTNKPLLIRVLQEPWLDGLIAFEIKEVPDVG